MQRQFKVLVGGVAVFLILLSARAAHAFVLPFARFQIAHENLKEIRIFAEQAPEDPTSTNRFAARPIKFTVKAVDQKNVEHELVIAEPELAADKLVQGLTAFDLNISASSETLFPGKKLQIHIDSQDPLQVKTRVTMESGINDSFKIHWNEANLVTYYSYYLESHPPERIRAHTTRQIIAGLTNFGEEPPPAIKKLIAHSKEEIILPPSTSALANAHASNLIEFWHQLEIVKALFHARIHAQIAKYGQIISEAERNLDYRIHIFRHNQTGYIKFVGEVRLLKKEAERLSAISKGLPSRAYVVFDSKAKMTVEGTGQDLYHANCWLTLKSAATGVLSSPLK